jgi:hypothetical protein
VRSHVLRKYHTGLVHVASHSCFWWQISISEYSGYEKRYLCLHIFNTFHIALFWSCKNRSGLHTK